MITRNHFSQISRTMYLALFLPVFFMAGCNDSDEENNSAIVYSPQNSMGAGPQAPSLSSSGVLGSTVNAGDLGAVGNYVILTKAGITNVTGSAITGNMGTSPIDATAITGFSLVADATNVFSTSTSVTGNVYAANYAAPTPSNLTTAIGSMEIAYTDAASRTSPDFNELAGGEIGGRILIPGLYTWTTSVSISTDTTISGGANDVWIFQTTGNITMASAKNIILSGGAQAKNIFWQVAGNVTVAPSAHFEGIILAKTAIVFQTLASLNGRAFSQTAVVLDNNAIVQP